MAKKNAHDDSGKNPVSRREFMQRSARLAAGVGLGCLASEFLWLEDAVAAYPVAGGYLLVDAKKCQGCLTCMLACSLANSGSENLSLARLQVMQNPFGKFPGDLALAQCRQCADPLCVKACTTGALYVDASRGNVRRVAQENCIGCGACLEACPHRPARVAWNPEENKAAVCDLCKSAAYWKQPGGINGKQACVEACPVHAIAFTTRLPVQEGDAGYAANLRGPGWAKLGYPID